MLGVKQKSILGDWMSAFSHKPTFERFGTTVEFRPLLMLLSRRREDAMAEAPVICMVGKAWDFHVEVALGIDPQGLAPGARFLAEHLGG